MNFLQGKNGIIKIQGWMFWTFRANKTQNQKAKKLNDDRMWCDSEEFKINKKKIIFKKSETRKNFNFHVHILFLFLEKWQ